MKFVQIVWDDEDLPEGNVQHIAEHGLTMEDVEYVLEHPAKDGSGSSTGRPCCFGHTRGGDFIIVVYEQVDEDSIYPVTAYEVPEP